MQRKPTVLWKKLMYGLLLLTFLAVIGLACFIQFNTGAAATFTDNVLRPLIGDSRVIALEGLFFNTADYINRIRYSIEKPKNPLMVSGESTLSLKETFASSSALDLADLPTTTPQTALSEEGQWHTIPLDLFPNKIVAADTIIRPDPLRPYAFATLVQMDMSALRLWSVAGTAQHNKETGKPGLGMVPKDIQAAGALIAAFNGGFLERDGYYGMIVENTTYTPLRKDLATIIGHRDGRVEITKYDGQLLGSDVVFARQNGPMLIENGVVKTGNDTNQKMWGHVKTANIYTWRSGIGVTSKGNIIFAAGNALVPSTLANALKAAGAVNAMQLDMNPNWVRFTIFGNFKDSTYASTTPIMRGIPSGVYSFLHGYGKDFFYITSKAK